MKNRIAWAMAALIIALSCMVNSQYKRTREAERFSETLENTVSSINQKAKITTIRLQDSLEATQAEVVSLQVTNRNLQSLYGDLLKSTKTKPKDVKSLSVISTVIAGRDTVICQVDSFGGLRAHWQDQYANILVDIDSARKAMVDYTIKDSLTVIAFQKRHSILFGLIKWKSYEGCKVITHNPKAKPSTVVVYENIKK